MMGAGMMAGQSPNMTGSQFDGQNPRRQQGAPDGHEADGALSKIAKKLGMGGFFGASGSGGTSRQRAANPTQGSAGKRQDPAISKKASELRARKLLQAQFNKLKGHRQLASELEFGSSNSSLFVNMCHHYARYARQHQLPINYAGCPKP